MTREEIRLQVAISALQGVLEAKLGVVGEVLPSVAVEESLKIADEFVKQWFKDDGEKEETVKEAEQNAEDAWLPTEEQIRALEVVVNSKQRFAPVLYEIALGELLRDLKSHRIKCG